MRTRIPIIAANWKMNKTGTQAAEFIHKLAPEILHLSTRIFVAPAFTAIAVAAHAAHGTKIVIGAQNMHEAEEGPFTGEVSAPMLKEAGARFVILGHSERRRLFHETDAQINSKVKRALSDGLLPLLCIGETLEERSKDQTKNVLSRQLEESLKEIGPCEMVIAYEPVWAIGTGKTATPEIAEEAHSFIREVIARNWGRPAAERLNILYGGSVTPENAPSLLKKSDIDGALVGGASLDPHKFIQIIQGAAL